MIGRTSLPHNTRLLITAAGLLLSGIAQANNCGEMPTSENVYNIVNEVTGQYLDVADGSTKDGANIHQWTKNGHSNQNFKVTNLGNGYWSIRPVNSDKSLDVYERSTREGATIVQWDYWGGDNQQWKLNQTDKGSIKILSRLSGQLVTVSKNYQGANVYQQSDRSSAYQNWYFNPVNTSCGGEVASSKTTDTGPTGFAGQPGNGLSTTTGGGNATPIQVSSCDELANALYSDGPAVIQVPDKTLDCRTQPKLQRACALTCGIKEPRNKNKLYYWVETGNNTCETLASSQKYFESEFKGRVDRTRNERRIIVKSNKTLEGLGANSRLFGVSLDLNHVENVIIRNLAIEVVNPDLIEAGDGISVMNSHHIWLDHLRTGMISDGHVDIYNTENMTMSWNRFAGENVHACGGQHSFVNLVSNSKITYHHNYWRKTGGRNPIVSGSKSNVHIFNNLWNDVSSYSIAAYDDGEVKIEGNYFENSAKPHWNYKNGLIDATIQSNIYTGRSATDSFHDTGQTLSWSVPYVYRLESATQARRDIAAGAGPQ